LSRGRFDLHAPTQKQGSLAYSYQAMAELLPVSWLQATPIVVDFKNQIIVPGG
jgi:hypothetical protein